MANAKNIYEKISAIMDNVKGLSKDTEVEYNHKTQYKAISENKVTKVVREQMIKQGLIVYPINQTYSRNGNLSSVNVIYRMVNTENPEEYIDIVSSGEGSDTQDKGVGKAMTYAYKYMLLRTFAIPTGEDTDFISSDTLTDAQNAVNNQEDVKPDVKLLSVKQLNWLKRAKDKHPEIYERCASGYPDVEALTMAQATKLIGEISDAKNAAEKSLGRV